MQYCDCGIHVYASVALAQRLGLVVLWVSCGHGRDETIGSWSRWVDRGATISANTCVSTCIINKIQGVVSAISDDTALAAVKDPDVVLVLNHHRNRAFGTEVTRHLVSHLKKEIIALMHT
jgi:hypothetical protein